MQQAHAHLEKDHYKTALSNGRHEFLADEPTDIGGTDLGPTPDELLCSALAACTSITLRMYADRKEWPLEAIKVNVSLERIDSPRSTQIRRDIELIGEELTDEQRERLMAIAKSCPVHRTLTHPIEVIG